MKNPITMTLDIYSANRNGVVMTLDNKSDHYNFPALVNKSGADFQQLLKDLQRCAENKEDEKALSSVQHFAEALLSAYEIQRWSYN